MVAAGTRRAFGGDHVILLLILAFLLVLMRPVEEARLVARALVIVVFLAPVVFMVLGSLRDVGLPPPRGFELIPQGAGVEAYRSIGRHVPLAHLFRNSAVVTLLAVPITVLVASWAGFAVSQLGRPMQRLLLGLTLGMLVIPLPMLWAPRFVLYHRGGGGEGRLLTRTT